MVTQLFAMIAGKNDERGVILIRRFEVIKDPTTSWKLTHEHSQGSVFSFPYGQPHRVTNILPLDSNPSSLQRYVHLLMPIHPKEGFDGSFISLPNLENKYFPNTESLAYLS